MKSILLSLLMIPFALFSQNKANEGTSRVNDELQTRIKMASERLVFGKEPEFTEDFILAGVTLDPKFPVRFSEYSGDQAKNERCQYAVKTGKAAIQYGPYLLSVDDVFSTPFLAEPSGGNIIFLPEKELMAGKIIRAKAPKESNLGEAYLKWTTNTMAITKLER